MTAIQRVPVKNLMKPTFEIVSSALQLVIGSIHPSIGLTSAAVTFVLRIISSTKDIQFHSAYDTIADIYMEYTNGTVIEKISVKSFDTENRLFTISLSKSIHAGTVSFKFTYTPSNTAFDKMSFGCGQNTCSVYVNRKLNLLVPHFDSFTKHKWSAEVTHPVGATVVTNTKAKSTTTSTLTRFQETTPILPDELSMVIIGNFVKQVSGTQVEYYLPSGTDVKEATGLVRELNSGLATKAKPTIPTGEMFFFIAISAMENYKFSGRNVALVGTSLLRSNVEILQNFAWNFIFRSVIYNKVTSADRKSAWVYDQSSLFLSTSVKSTNKDIWKKHYYEIVMSNGRNDMKGLVNQPIAYEDERRYVEKHHHVAKVSTILGMLVTVTNDTSTDPLTILDNVRNNDTSPQFFFMNSQLKLVNGAPIDVDRVISCYVNNPVSPLLHINRTSPTQVAIQRASGRQADRCDMNLWLEKGKKSGTTGNKEHTVLSDKVDKIEVNSDSPVLLSGEAPFSAYGYTLEQTEFDRLLDVSVLDSYDNSSVDMLCFNAFIAAGEGTISYESLDRFMNLVVTRKIVSVDEAVDLWMRPVTQSRNETLIRNFSAVKIITSVLNSTGEAPDIIKVGNYIVDRFTRDLKAAPLVEIEKATKLVKGCGEKCIDLFSLKYRQTFACVSGSSQDCSFESPVVEIHVCLSVKSDPHSYAKFDTMFVNCLGKPCRIPVIRGLLCTKDSANLEKWLSETMNMDITDVVERQVVRAIFDGLASNDVSKPLLFPYLMENWHLIHQKYAEFPVLLGDVIVSLTSTITTLEQLVQVFCRRADPPIPLGGSLRSVPWAQLPWWASSRTHHDDHFTH